MPAPLRPGYGVTRTTSFTVPVPFGHIADSSSSCGNALVYPRSKCGVVRENVRSLRQVRPVHAHPDSCKGTSRCLFAGWCSVTCRCHAAQHLPLRPVADPLVRFASFLALCAWITRNTTASAYSFRLSASRSASPPTHSALPQTHPHIHVCVCAGPAAQSAARPRPCYHSPHTCAPAGRAGGRAHHQEEGAEQGG